MACNCCASAPCDKCSATAGAVLPQLPCVLGCMPSSLVINVSLSFPTQIVFFGNAGGYVRQPAATVSGTVSLLRFDGNTESFQGCGFGYNQESGTGGLSVSQPYRDITVSFYQGKHDSIIARLAVFMCLRWTEEFLGTLQSPLEGFFTSFPCWWRPSGTVSNAGVGVEGLMSTAADATGQTCYRSGSLAVPEGSITIVEAVR